MTMPPTVELDIRVLILTPRSPEKLSEGLADKLFQLFGDGEDRILSDGEYVTEATVTSAPREERSGFLFGNKPIESLSRRKLIDSLKKIATALDNELGRAKKRIRDLGGGLFKEE